MLLSLSPIQNPSVALHYLKEEVLVPSHGLQDPPGSDLTHLSDFSFCYPLQLYSTDTELFAVLRMHHRLSCLCSIPSTWQAVHKLHPPYHLSCPFCAHFYLSAQYPTNTHTSTHARTRKTCQLRMTTGFLPKHLLLFPPLPHPCVSGRHGQVLTRLHSSYHSWLVYRWSHEPRWISSSSSKFPMRGKNWHDFFLCFKMWRETGKQSEERFSTPLCCRPATSLPLLLSPFPFTLWKRPSIFPVKSFS